MANYLVSLKLARPVYDEKLGMIAFRTVGSLPSIELARAPLYLRFVYRIVDGRPAWDALDQLDDHPSPDETIIAARRGEKGTVHVDGSKNGRRFALWYTTYQYHEFTEQPADDVMRDPAKWQAFCVELHKSVRTA